MAGRRLPVTVFHDRRLPEPGRPAGYAALIDEYGLKVSLPFRLVATGERHRTIETDDWLMLTARHAPAPGLGPQLFFALRYEGVDLGVLAALFKAVPHAEIASAIRARPTGIYSRRAWFLYEWLTGRELDLPSTPDTKYVDALDPAMQFAVPGDPSRRHRVRNNLPGTPAFCPLVRRTERLGRFVGMDLSECAREVVGPIRRDVLARTAAFLLLKDSKASYAIEGERPPQSRIERWGRAIGQAGRNMLDTEELLRLQRLVIGDARFVRLGWRREGGFVGIHDRETGTPVPDHVSARPEDLVSLIGGVLAYERRTDGGRLDPVIAAAALAFGFVFIHPFEDGNGRIHRYLIHHALAAGGFNPPGIVFPVSAAIQRRIDDYRSVLERYSRAVLPLVEWEPTPDGNVRVLNETADCYRYFDATPQAEFLYECVEQTILEDLPLEIRFLESYDRFREGVQAVADMADRRIDLLYRFLAQNDGRLSRRARAEEFAALDDDEAVRIERIFGDAFAGRAAG